MVIDVVILREENLKLINFFHKIHFIVDGFSLGAPESACGIKAPEYLNPLMCSNSPNTEVFLFFWEFFKILFKNQ